MTNYTKDAIDFAFENKLSDMQSAIQDAIKSKISDALEVKKFEVAQGMFGVSEAWGDDDEDDDVARADRELARMKAKPIKAAKGVDPEKDMSKLAKKTKEPEEVDEEVEELDEISSKLAYRTASKRGERMSKAWRANDMDTFEKERGKAEKTYNIATKKAKAAEKKNPQKPEQSYPLGGYSRTSNRSYSEEVEAIQELSKDTLKSYVDKRQWDMGANEKAQKKMDTGLARAETKLKGDQHKLDKNKNGKLDSHDFKLLRKESEELEEKLSVSDGVQAWIKDFVDSDNPKFEGKSKKERIQMALGAFYAAKKGTNEEIEDIQELSKDTLQGYVNKRQWSMGVNAKMQKKLDTNLDRAEKKIKNKSKTD